MKWLEKLGGDKKERILILLLAGVLLLVIVIPTGQGVDGDGRFGAGRIG
ncbi:MAG: hypothetical protein ACLTLE_02720 [Lachnospiraceae bacterium]